MGWNCVANDNKDSSETRQRDRERAMERVFSVEEISEPFLLPAAADESSSKPKSTTMNRSASEWAFQRFLQEASSVSVSLSVASPCSSSSSVVEVKQDLSPNTETKPLQNGASLLPSGTHPPSSAAVDSEEYQAILKTKLNLACAAVALTRVFSFFFFHLIGGF